MSTLFSNYLYTKQQNKTDQSKALMVLGLTNLQFTNNVVTFYSKRALKLDRDILFVRSLSYYKARVVGISSMKGI